MTIIVGFAIFFFGYVFGIATAALFAANDDKRNGD